MKESGNVINAAAATHSATRFTKGGLVRKVSLGRNHTPSSFAMVGRAFSKKSNIA